jgi:hypothetical protein
MSGPARRMPLTSCGPGTPPGWMSRCSPARACWPGTGSPSPRRVRVPRRLHRRRRGRAPRRRRRARPARAPALPRPAVVGRDQDAGGHDRVPADGEDHRRGHRAQGRGPALRGVPPPSHDRRGLRVLGVARPGDPGGTGRADRLPRAPRIRGAGRTAIPHRRAGGGELACARPGRRGRARRRAAALPGPGARGAHARRGPATRGAGARPGRRRRFGLGLGAAHARARPPRRGRPDQRRRHRCGHG